jgi:hypothetical protein
MKKTAKNARGTKTKQAAAGQIHPIVIYPFKQPNDYADLEALYGLVARLASNRKVTPARSRSWTAKLITPWKATALSWISETIPSRATRRFLTPGASIPARCGTWAWARPSSAAPRTTSIGSSRATFNYGTAAGQEVLGGLHDLPEIILELDQDVCVGEIATGHNNSKHLIDTYGTFALLYTWFPAEAQEIRQFTERPRSEFFAVRHCFLREALMQRWYPYEQTVVMLLAGGLRQETHQPLFGRQHLRCPKAANRWLRPCNRSSAPSAFSSPSGASATSSRSDWIQQYRQLEAQSEQVRRAAFTILQNHLT